jgi:dolichol kinase
MKRIAELVLQQLSLIPFPTRFPTRLPSLQMRNDLHLVRKVWHMFMGLAMASMYFTGMSAHAAILSLVIALCISVTVEFMRLRVPSINERVIRLWGPVMRSCEVNRVSGIPFYILATLLAIGIFPKPIAVLSILYLAIGDPMASLFGILYGKYGVRFANGKSMIGTLAGIAACTLVGFFFLKTLFLPAPVYLAITLIGGVAGGTAELMPLDMDDNLSIPIVSGFVLWLAFIVFGV